MHRAVCGTDNPEGSRFCFRRGSSLETTGPPLGEPGAPTSVQTGCRRPLIFIGPGALALPLGFGVLAIPCQRPESSPVPVTAVFSQEAGAATPSPTFALDKKSNLTSTMTLPRETVKASTPTVTHRPTLTESIFTANLPPLSAPSNPHLTPTTTALTPLAT
jgi:hypothetical protein